MDLRIEAFQMARLVALAHLQLELGPSSLETMADVVRGTVVRIFVDRTGYLKVGDFISLEVPSPADWPGTAPSAEAWRQSRFVEVYLDASGPGWTLAKGQITLLRVDTKTPANPADVEGIGVAEGSGFYHSSVLAHPPNPRMLDSIWKKRPRLWPPD